MTWLWLMVRDYFFAFGVLIFFGFIAVMVFLDGKVNDVSTGPLFMGPVIYAWFMGEFWHWPKELEQ